jgi:flavorubredoxin
MKSITNDIYYVGVNDRQKRLFENLWPLPRGVSYNSYLIADEKNVLIDTVDICYSELFFKKIDSVLKGGKIDCLIVNHMEPDHSGCIRLLREKYPDMRIAGNKQTFDMLAGYHRITEGLYEVKEGDTLNTGAHTFTFYMAPMVHWPEVMFTYDRTDRVLFSADAFGTFGTLDGGVTDRELNTGHYWDEMVRYYSNIVGKYGIPVQKAIRKLSGVDVRIICPTHGPVWTEQKTKAVDLYDRLSRYEGVNGVTIVYGSMYGHVEQMAETVASSLSGAGIREIALHDASHTHVSYILRDLFKYKGVIIGSPTYSARIFPAIDSLLGQIALRDIRNRLFGCFGSFTWAGAAVKRLTAFGEEMKWETVGDPVEQKQNADTEEPCMALGKAMARRLQ